MSIDSIPRMYSRLDPEMTARTRRRVEAQARATRAQAALEYVLFAVFGTTIVIAAIALIVTNSDSFERVPNRVEAGIRADRVNVLVMQTFKNSRTDAIETDALLLMSIKPSTHEVAVTSIPRDLWVRLGKYGQRRLAAAPAVGSQSGYPGQGPGLTADTIENVLGQPVHAYIRIDRRELAGVIDALGGIDIDVSKSFYEYRRGDRFTRGRHHLNGARALRFAFSPYVRGPQGGRFERESRQQQLMAAILARASAPETFARLAALDFGERTNLTPQQVSWIASAIDEHEPRRVTLAPYMDTFEVTTFTESGVAVRPRNGDYRPIRDLIANVFSSQTAIVAR